MRTLLPFLLLACSKPAQSPAPEPAAAPEPTAEAPAEKPAGEEAATPLGDEMQNHWVVATEARNRVIHGDIAGARVIARGLAQRPLPETMPENWRPLYADMQAKAAELGRADTVEAAGARLGDLGLTCNECHDYTSSGPKYLAIPMPPPELPAGTSDMPLHKWAVDWLWVGLIAQDTEAWNRAAKALEEAPFAPRPGAPRSEVGLDAMEHLVHLLPGMVDEEDRALHAQRFGETVTACALCHGEVVEAGLKAPMDPEAPKEE